MNEEVKEKRTELNRAKKMFRRRNTSNNLAQLKEKEDAYFSECDKAKNSWIDETCEKIEMHTDPKESWREFMKLTSYNREQEDILPLLDDGRPVFGVEEKCKLMKDVFFFGGKHMLGEELDEDFKKETDRRVKGIQERMKEQKYDEFLNEKIREEETEAAIQMLHKNKAPGPDNIYGELRKKGKEALITAINILFNKSLHEKTVTQDCKLAKVKFLRKPGKSSYHIAISLTSILGKCLEKIVFTRLYSFVEHYKILDPEQECFRRFHGTSMALLRLV